MALKSFKPVTPGLRQLVIVDRSELYKGKPVKALTVGKSSSGGRNNSRSVSNLQTMTRPSSCRMREQKREDGGPSSLS